MIPLSVPVFKGNEWDYIKECLDTGWVSSSGSFVNRFEYEIQEYTNAKFAIGCVNCTSALHISLIIVGVKAGDEVIVPTLSFIATANVVKYLDAIPIFMDCDEYYNMDMKKTFEFILTETIFKNGSTYNKRTKRKIAAIIPVHIFGNPVDLEKLIGICNERNIKIVEDAAESLGSYYTQGKLNGKFTGTVGDIGCFSFNGNKIITTGGGGMIVTENREFAERAKYLTSQAKDDSINYVHHEIGYNYRITNLQAALGVAQLENLESYIKQKYDNYNKFRKGINGIKGLKLAITPNYARANHWFYALQINPNEYYIDRKTLIRILQDNGIQARPIWKLIHTQLPYKGNQTYKINKAYKLLNSTLNIPCSVNLRIKDIKKIIAILRSSPKSSVISS